MSLWKLEEKQQMAAHKHLIYTVVRKQRQQPTAITLLAILFFSIYFLKLLINFLSETIVLSSTGGSFSGGEKL